MVNEPLRIVAVLIAAYRRLAAASNCCFPKLHLMRHSDRAAIGGEADMARPQLIGRSCAMLLDKKQWRPAMG
jgi:hypothetical protein